MNLIRNISTKYHNQQPYQKDLEDLLFILNKQKTITQDLIILKQGRISTLKNVNWVFDKYFLILMQFNASTDGVLFQFVSNTVEGNRIIENGIQCYISKGSLHYCVIYRRYDLFRQLLEDYTSDDIVDRIELNKWLNLSIQHECGRLYLKSKFYVNGKQSKQIIEYPKIKQSNLQMEYGLNIDIQIKEIKIYNEPITNKNAQPYYQIVPQKSIQHRIRDKNRNSVYELFNYEIHLQNESPLGQIGGIQTIVPLFHMAISDDTLSQLFRILCNCLGWMVNHQQIIENKLLQQIAQVITIPISNECLDYIGQMTEPKLMKGILKMLFDLNFIAQVEDIQHYCVLLQQIYFSNPKAAYTSFNIPDLAQVLISQQCQIQDQVLQLMIFGCQYDLSQIKAYFPVFLKMAQASEICLKLKILQTCLRLVSDLIKGDLENFMNFRNSNLQQNILHDILFLLQTDSYPVIIYILQLMVMLLQNTQNELDIGVISYIRKVIILQEDNSELIGLVFQLMIINIQSVSILLFIFEKTKNNLIISELLEFVQKRQDQDKLFEYCGFQLLDLLVQNQNQNQEQIIEIFISLGQKSNNYLTLIMIWFNLRKNNQILTKLLSRIVDYHQGEYLFRITNQLSYFHICVEPLLNFQIFLEKVLSYIIECIDEQALQQFVTQSQFIYLLNQLYNTDKQKWCPLFIKLINRIVQLQTNEAEQFIVYLIQLTELEGLEEEVINSISFMDRQPFHFDFNQFQNSFELNQSVINDFTEQMNYAKINESIQLGEITQAISVRSSTMQISLYKLYNRMRKARSNFKILFNELRMTYYTPWNCSFQYDAPINQEYQFQENMYYKQKIYKYITQNYTRPFLKIQFHYQVQYKADLQIPLQRENTIECHQVKSLYLRQCGITVQNDQIILNYSSYTQEQNHITLMPHNLQFHHIFYKRWPVKAVFEIYDRIYIRNSNAIEITFIDGDQLYLVFNDEFARNGFLLHLNYQNNKIEFENTNNFKYLMLLNFKSSRSFIDLTRYPVFPWVLKGEASDFDDTLESILNPNNYRDLSQPIGACGSEKRLNQFIKRFENDHFYYGTHYSSQALISQYLIRLPPFTDAAIQIQDGKFDIADRLYRSIMKSWMDCNEEMADVRELTPEFFYLPEMFLNINGYHFGKLQSGQEVHNVILPFHANKNPFYYVSQNYIALENSLANNITDWIDLIWGYKQQGEEAINAFNLFYPITYSNCDSDKLEINEIALEAQIAHFGQTPEQLFTKPHQSRKDEEIIQLNKCFKCKINQIVIFLECIDNKIIVFLQDHTCLIYKLNLQKSILQSICTLERILQLQSIQFDPLINYSVQPIVVMKDSLIFGGQRNGKLAKVELDKGNQTEIETLLLDTCSAIAYCQLLICGFSNGQIQVFEEEKVIKSIYYSTSQVNVIKIFNQMRVFLTGHSDGNILIFNLFNQRLYRRLTFTESIEHLEFSDNPIGCILFVQDKTLYSYSINGFYLAKRSFEFQIDNLKIIRDRINYLLLMNRDQVFKIGLPFLQNMYLYGNYGRNCTQQQKLMIFGNQIVMNEYVFYYHSLNVSVIDQNLLAYEQNQQVYGILIDMWKLVMSYMNSQDIYFLDYEFQFQQTFYNDSTFPIFLNFKKSFDYDVSYNYFENSFEYDINQYDLTQQIITENYLFVFLDSFMPIAQKVFQQIIIYVGFLIIPWLFMNLNFIAIFLLDLAGKPYYKMMKLALYDIVMIPKKNDQQMCRLIYKIIFIMISFILLIVITTDFIYIIISTLAKSNFQTILNMKDNGAIGCYNYNDQFLNNLFFRDRGLQGVIGTNLMDCVNKLQNQEVDVILVSEFSLLYILQDDPDLISKLRFQVNLNQNIEHSILINKSQPQWFKDAIKQAIDIIVIQKLDLLVRDKYLPNQLYNNKISSIISNSNTFQLTCLGISVFFIMLLQITAVLKLIDYRQNHRVFKCRGWKLRK